MKWIVDMEAFQIGGKWYPKEIALLNPVTLEWTSLMVKCNVPYKLVVNRHVLPTIKSQFARHRIYWDEGEYTLAQAKQIITGLVNMEVDTVFVKGDQKEKFFQSWFARLEQIVAPTFKELCQYPKETCGKHNNHFCARRKCFELVPYVVDRNF